MNKTFGTIVQIGDVLVSEEVFTEFFACNYASCKGICCIEGDAGAPLKEKEIAEIEYEYNNFSTLMSDEGRKAAESSGFFEMDRDGDLVTPVVKGRGECAYSMTGESGECLCAIEKCFLEGKCRFRKPVSCQLYPIRVTEFPGGGQALNVHHWDICKDAFSNGAAKGIRVYRFLKDALTRVYGSEFYEALEAAAPKVIAETED